jgi:diacylglycerol O-acyltransferase
MDEAIAEVASRPLDRRRPLWELYVLEGLDDGRIGILVKIHHALADGVAAAQLLANVMSPDSEVTEPAEGPRWASEPVPDSWRLVLDALFDAVAALFRLPSLIRATVRNVPRARRASREAGVRLPRPIFDAPNVSFSRALTPHRSFATTSLPLQVAKEVASANQVTLNDVVLATAGGALRAYLMDRDELPAKSLTASVPVSTDPPGVTHLSGNHVSNLFTTLATDLDNPLARLRTIHDVTAVAKEVNRLLGTSLMEDWVEYTPPRPYAWVMREYGRLRLANWHPPPVNVVVSNVAGPREPLYAAGARLVELYSVGPILEGVGLNITLWSYLGDMNVGILGCRELVPEPRRIGDLMHAALDELAAASSVQSSSLNTR